MPITGLENNALGRAALGIGAEDFSASNANGEKNAFDHLVKRLESAKQEEVDKGEKKPLIDKTDKLYEQCQELEAFLIKNLLNSMRSTVEKAGFIDEGFAGRMYEDMLYDEYAKEFAKNANFGFAETAYLELTGQRGKVINRTF
jgi:flagellar protein FlgJ